MPRSSTQLSDFGELIERLRAGIPRGRRPSITEIGERVGVSRATWHRVRTGKADLAREELARLADILEVDVATVATPPRSQPSVSAVNFGEGSERRQGSDFTEAIQRIVEVLSQALDDETMSASSIFLGLNWIEQVGEIEGKALPASFWPLRRVAHETIAITRQRRSAEEVLRAAGKDANH